MSGSAPQTTRRRGPAYDYRDHPDQRDWVSRCDACGNRARWSIARPEDWPNDGPHIDIFNWTVRAFACGQHLHGVLDRLDWIDCVQVYDLAAFPEGGC